MRHVAVRPQLLRELQSLTASFCADRDRLVTELRSAPSRERRSTLRHQLRSLRRGYRRARAEIAARMGVPWETRPAPPRE